MELKDTATLMTSEDFKDRFVAEYMQLVTRIDGLARMLDNMDAGTLMFEPKTPHKVLLAQLYHMEEYADTLRERSVYEGIELPTDV